MTVEQMQKSVFQNKVEKGFNVSDVNKEFCLLYGEVGEAYDAWRKHDVGLVEELADIAIYLMGLSEILGVDLERAIENKIEINKNRQYKNIDGTLIKVDKK